MWNSPSHFALTCAFGVALLLRWPLACRRERRNRFWQWTWMPGERSAAPGTKALCALNGRLAVPLQENGVVFRGDAGESVALSGEARSELDWSVASRRCDLLDISIVYGQAKVACADSTAYVLAGTDHVLTEYKTGAEPRLVAMPAELVEAARKRMEQPSGNAFYPGYEALPGRRRSARHLVRWRTDWPERSWTGPWAVTRWTSPIPRPYGATARASHSAMYASRWALHRFGRQRPTRFLSAIGSDPSPSVRGRRVTITLGGR